jgi:dihydropteroate synthase
MSTSTRSVTRIGPATFAWGLRTYLMGILNVTPDSFSGDGLLQGGAEPGAADAGAAATAEPGAADAAPRAPGAGDAVERAVARARRMVDEGADILDVGGESTRPGHAPVDDAEELARVVPVVRAIRAALPDTPISVDTTKPAVAASALEAGADCINDVWGTGSSDEMPHLAADRGAAYVLMHNRGEARYVDVVREVIADLQHGMDRAIAAGVPWESIVVDPGIGFGKTMEHNLVLLHHLADLSMLGRPILLGTSRKSTIGRVLGGLPPDERLEGTLATTALGIAAGVDIVRVHDVLPNARVARMCDAIVRIEEEARA